MPRWSYHLERPPGTLQPFIDRDPAFGDWLKQNIYDRAELSSSDTFDSFVNEYRRTAASLGVRADETDANVIYAVYLLDTGQTTWRQIAGEAGSAPTTSGEAPLLDVIAQQQQTAIASFRSQIEAAGGEADSTDAAILAGIEAIGAQTFQLPAGSELELAAVYAVPPTPLRDEAQDRVTAGVTRASEYSGLSSFQGFGPSGSFIDTPAGAAPVPPLGAGGIDRGTLMILAVIAIGAFLLLSQRGS